VQVEGAGGDVGPHAVMVLGQGQAVGAGFISITPLRADMTDDAWLTDLARVLSGGG
jgi:hypothetical protein